MPPSMRLEGAAAKRTQRSRRQGVITSGRGGRGAANPRTSAAFSTCLGLILMPFFTLVLRATPGGGPDCTAVLGSGGAGGTGMSAGGSSVPTASFTAWGAPQTNLAHTARSTAKAM